MKSRSTLLGSAAIISLASPALAQSTTPPTDSAAQPAATTTQQPTTPTNAQSDTGAAQAVDEDYGDEEPIVIQGTRARGSVIGDIPPQNILDSRDIRATGATSINDLLDALAPQIGSSQGRGGEQPVLLLNGQRISSFRELRDIPPEALERVEILPEEVALKYGYRADQKVVNIVLRQRFRSTTAQVGAGLSTDGGYANGSVDLTQFMIEKNGRTTLNLHAEGNSLLTENERNIILQETPPTGATTDDLLAARSLLPSKRDLRASGTFNRQVFGDVSGTLNTELEHTDSRALVGLGDTLLEVLARNTDASTAHAGLTLNGTKSNWHWTLTSNADLAHTITSTDQDEPPNDSARETTASGDIKGTANGNLFRLPAGDVSSTITLGGTTTHLNSEHRISAVDDSTSLGRTTGEAAINLDLPISRRNKDFSALGNLTLNGNAEIDQLSDFGTLFTIGAGANWSPIDRLNLLTSWTREDGPPTINQLGDPVLITPNTRIFDFVTGQTVLVSTTTGGNPELQSDRRNVFKFGGNWQPFENTDLRLRAEYVHQTIANPISSVTVTPTIEAAFPDRFVRDDEGELVSVDLRPLNFESSRRDTLRIGFDFSKPLKSRQPSQSVIEQLRAQFRGGGGGRRQSNGAANGQATTPPSGQPGQGAAAQAGPPPSGGEQPGPPPSGGSREGGGRGFRGGGRGGGFFGGGNRGRLTFSLTDTITFVDQVTVAPGFPVVDYLHGDAAGQSGGTPRHNVQAQAGYFNNGIGARLVGNLRSGTTVDTLTGDNLHFSPLATFDLRLFANPGDIPEAALKHAWLRGTQVQLRLDNMFNSRPKVHDITGAVPLSYQPGLLDPLGRTIMISFRKLFLPNPSWFRRQFQEMRQGQSR
jgi:TonB-dependent Receptor Plug Domain